MFWILTTLVLLGAAAASWKFRPKVSGTSSYGENTYSNEGRPFVSAAFLAAWLLLTIALSINTVPAGHIGLVRTFGDYSGKQSPGLNVKAPFQSVDKVDGRVLKRTIEMTGGDKGSAGSIDQQPVYVKLVINYQLELDQATELYRQVGERYYSKIVEPAVQDAFKAEVVKYKAIEVAPNREKIREAVRAKLDRTLSERGIDVKSLLIKDLDFSQDFVRAIERKQVATEDAKAAAEKVAITKAEADSAREKARGKADAALIAAKAEAKSIAIKGQALRRNPKGLELAWIEKINPGVQTIYLPSGSSNLVQIPSPSGN